MRHTKYPYALLAAAILIATGSFVSCKKTDDSNTPAKYNTVTADLNGQPWEHNAKCFAHHGEDNTIGIGVGDMEKRLNLIDVPYLEGKKDIFGWYGPKISPRDSVEASFTYVDYDVAKAFYDVDLGKDNEIDITRYDAQAGEIEGTFKVQFYKMLNLRLAPGYPDTLRFTNGHFRLKLEYPE